MPGLCLGVIMSAAGGTPVTPETRCVQCFPDTDRIVAERQGLDLLGRSREHAYRVADLRAVHVEFEVTSWSNVPISARVMFLFDHPRSPGTTVAHPLVPPQPMDIGPVLRAVLSSHPHPRAGHRT